jgi:archaellum component FlaF (FlaF/FlaG flagellin family)
MFVVGLLIAGIVYLIKLAQNCLEATGYYESFTDTKQSNYTQELKQRIQKIKELNTVLDASIDTFNDNIQDTCDVYAQVEDIFVGNNSTPNSDYEYNLPKAELDQILERRKQSAKKRFQEAKNIYGTSINTTVYECFTDTSDETIPDLEDELLIELRDLETKIHGVEVGSIGQKGNSLNALLKFNNKYIKKSLQQMGNEKARFIEGFDENPQLQQLTGSELLIRADKAILKANKIYDEITDQHTSVQKQKELVKEITKAASRIESGDITTGDISSSN